MQTVFFAKENNLKFCLMLLLLVLNSTLCDNNFANTTLFFPIVINLQFFNILFTFFFCIPFSRYSYNYRKSLEEAREWF